MPPTDTGGANGSPSQYPKGGPGTGYDPVPAGGCHGGWNPVPPPPPPPDDPTPPPPPPPPDDPYYPPPPPPEDPPVDPIDPENPPGGPEDPQPELPQVRFDEIARNDFFGPNIDSLEFTSSNGAKLELKARGDGVYFHDSTSGRWSRLADRHGIVQLADGTTVEWKHSESGNWFTGEYDHVSLVIVPQGDQSKRVEVKTDDGKDLSPMDLPLSDGQLRELIGKLEARVPQETATGGANGGEDGGNGTAPPDGAQPPVTGGGPGQDDDVEGGGEVEGGGPQPELPQVTVDEVVEDDFWTFGDGRDEIRFTSTNGFKLEMRVDDDGHVQAWDSTSQRWSNLGNAHDVVQLADGTTVEWKYEKSGDWFWGHKHHLVMVIRPQGGEPIEIKTEDGKDLAPTQLPLSDEQLRELAARIEEKVPQEA